MPLRQELRNEMKTCPLTDKQFIPLDVIHNKITTERIREKLPPRPWYSWWLCRDYDLNNRLHRARKVVAVLTLMARCEEIESLLENGLTDEHLPLSNVDGSVRSPHCGGKTFSWFYACSNRHDLVDLFLENQWKVLTPVLELKPDGFVDISLDPQCALPFDCEEVIAETKFSVVYKAMLLPGHRIGGENTGHVAIKKIISSDLRAFGHEKKNLDKVRPIMNKHLVKHLAICEQAQCIFLPWAYGGNLSTFWAHDQKKIERTADVFQWSLRQLTGLVHAMADLHHVNIRHGDLKPDNILHFSEGGVKLGTLKIADFGVSRIHPKEQPTNLRVQHTLTTASTWTYEAPEASKMYKTKEPRSRRYDCWSMGCMILEFAVWLLYDYSAITNFKPAREDPDNAYYRCKPGYTYNPEDGMEHGIEVHPRVSEAIGRLKADDRCSGTALGALVDLVESDLLKILPEGRLTSVELHRKLEGIVKRATEDTSYLFNGAGRPSPEPEIFCHPPPPQSDPQVTNGYP